MPHITDFLGLPQLGGPALTHRPSSSVPHLNHPATATVAQPGPYTLLPLIPHLATPLRPLNIPPQGSADLDWADILAEPLHAPIPTHVMPDSGYAASKPAINWVALSPAFLNADVKMNDHKLVPTGILDMLHIMICLKLFIPLSMLMTTSLSCICFNDNLKFKNIPFGNAVGKYALNEAHFPSEDSLTDAEYLQAHKHWLFLIKVSSECTVYGSWKAHHDKMCDNPDMLKSSWAWQSHDKQLCCSFMDHLFIIDPDSITYCHQFEHARLDSWENLPSCHSP